MDSQARTIVGGEHVQSKEARRGGDAEILTVLIGPVGNVSLQAFVDEIPLRNLGVVFDPANDSRDLVNDSRSASPTPSLASNR